MASRALKIDPKIAKDPEAASAPQPADETTIAARAYALWQERGCPVGSDQEDWFRAEEELKKRTEVATAT